MENEIIIYQTQDGKTKIDMPDAMRIDIDRKILNTIINFYSFCCCACFSLSVIAPVTSSILSARVLLPWSI